jgi:tetratricopeptide (TPR) repeat protein
LRVTQAYSQLGVVISLKRHLEYASGYIALGLLTEATNELEEIEGEDRLCATVMAVRNDLYLALKSWDLLIAVARELTRQRPKIVDGWINWAFALRELGRIDEAKAVLLTAEPMHGKKSAVLHYNLACYECLLGDIENARARLAVATRKDPEFKKEALDDPDLAAMWNAKG